MEDTKYFFSSGELFKKDFTVKFKMEDKKNLNVPIERLSEIYCFNDITITTKFLEMLSKNNIIIHYFNYYGNYVGTFYPKDKYLSGRLLVEQVSAYKNKRELIAKNIVIGISKNIHNILYHYYRHGKTDTKEYLDWIKYDFIKLINKANNINQIMAIEGNLWDGFYKSFKFFLPEDFIINKRVRRPPDNPMNALISFGNTLLYTKTITQLYHTHLNQTISFLHEPAERRFSLSLDLSEVFKPIIVYKTIFDCVNNRKLSVEKHFDKNLNYSILNETGKKIFIQAFEDRLNNTFLHPKLKRRVSYKQAIKLDAYKLIKFIIEDREFIPFNMEDKI